MKSAIATHGLSHGHYVIQIDGRAKSHHRLLMHYEKACNFEISSRSMYIKVCVMQLSRERKTSVH
jgi:hypothetical protein